MSQNFIPCFQGIKALHSPETGIVDWGVVSRSYGANFKKMGGDIHLNFKVKAFNESPDPEYPVTIKGVNSVSYQKRCMLLILNSI